MIFNFILLSNFIKLWRIFIFLNQSNQSTWIIFVHCVVKKHVSIVLNSLNSFQNVLSDNTVSNHHWYHMFLKWLIKVKLNFCSNDLYRDDFNKSLMTPPPPFRTWKSKFFRFFGFDNVLTSKKPIFEIHYLEKLDFWFSLINILWSVLYRSA